LVAKLYRLVLSIKMMGSNAHHHYLYYL
jgi:hypothetical protein